MRAETHPLKWEGATPLNWGVPRPRGGVCMEPIFIIFNVSRNNKANRV